MDYDEKLKTRYQWVTELRQAYWQSYLSRREYEWKISLGVWGALVATIAVLVKESATPVYAQAWESILSWAWVPRYLFLQIAVLLATVCIGLLHTLFLRFIRRAHYIDQTRYEACVQWQREQADIPDALAVQLLVGGISRNDIGDLSQGCFEKLLNVMTRDLLQREKLCRVKLHWHDAHIFQMDVTWLLVLTVNVVLLLNRPPQ